MDARPAMAHTQSPDGDVRCISGLAYAAPLGFRPLLLDLYLPAACPRPGRARRRWSC